MDDQAGTSVPAEGSHSKDDAAGRAFPVVGIGASAGGLDSFVRLLNALPAQPGVAIALLQHLDPRQHSMLTDILSRSSKLPVTEATDGVVLRPDHVYVMPPNTTMRVKGGALFLKQRPKKSAGTLPIDAFFESLAAESGTHAVGVVLSGTGTDGMHGLAAIRGAGGLTYAEEPSSAEYDGMPRASIEAGVVDAVLDAQGIAAELVRLGTQMTDGEPEGGASPQDLDALREILELVRRTTGLDLSQYRRTTLLRRISRRMLLEGSDSMPAYLATLEGDPAKVQALYRDVLVNMTQFFRDPVVLEALSREVLPRIAERKDSKTPIRIWVPGCSRGQEAYSILMVVVEYLEKAALSVDIQMFASDVNEQDIAFARAGVYPEGIERDVSAERLARFFVKVTSGYQVTRALREMCVFAVHDITQDPPFSRLDLISFRNVLIYMERPLQDHVLHVLHYALVPSGFLVLGTSESVREDSSRFEVVDKKNKIFARKPGPAKLLPRMSPFRDHRVGTQLAAPATDEGFDVLGEADRVVQGGYQPPGLVLSPDLRALQFRGNVGPSLTPAEGPPDMKLSRLLPAGLAAAVEGAVRAVDRSGAPARRSAVMRRDGLEREVDIEVIPLSRHGKGSVHCLALFSERPTSTRKANRASEKRGSSVDSSGDVAALIRERDEAREQLEAFVSERESANADLQTLSEKLQSSNEELRTINEEFQTAQEELQSTNEELTTLNDELRNRNIELVQLADDLSNVIEGVEIPILILSRDLRIRRFTPEAQTIVSIVANDVGRPLTDFRLKVDVPDLSERALEVLRQGVPYTREVAGDEGRWHSMRIRPYRTNTGATDGVVIAFIDVHELKQNQRAAEFAREHAEAVVETVRQPLVTLRPDLTVAEANGAFHEMFGSRSSEIVGRSFFELRDGTWDVPDLRSGVATVLSDADEFGDVDVDRWFEGLGRRIMRVSGRLVREDVGSRSVLLTIEDVTVRTRRQALTTALNDIGNILASTVDFDGVLQRVLEESSESLEAESAALLLKQDSSWVTKGVYGLPDELTSEPLADEDLPVTADVIEAGAPLLLSELPNVERFASCLGIDSEHGAFLVVPILLRDQSIGVLAFHFRHQELIFTEAEDDFARRLATTMAFALESADLYAIQSAIAETLQTTKDKLLRQMAEREQWLSGISHDLRTPLAAIRGYAELLVTEDDVPEEILRQTTIILGQSKRIQKLISDMLLAFQIEGGHLPVELRRTDLSEVLDNVEELVRTDPRFMERDVRFLGETAACFSVVDFAHLTRALTNVVFNALTHNPKETHVVVSVECGGDTNEIAVSDDGNGIDDETLMRVWERFKRGTSSSQDTDGVGLGMATTRHLVELMRGEISVSSRAGQGTTITMRFPAS